MLEILEAILEVIVDAKDQKKGTIILHGAPNSGKSSIIRVMDEIFICDTLQQTQGNFDIVPDLKRYKFQVVLCEETRFDRLLDKNHLDNTKLFFERKGKPVEGKGKAAKWMYRGAANILSSQYFDVSALEPLHREALTARCNIIYLKNSHSS